WRRTGSRWPSGGACRRAARWGSTAWRPCRRRAAAAWAGPSCARWPWRAGCPTRTWSSPSGTRPRGPCTGVRAWSRRAATTTGSAAPGDSRTQDGDPGAPGSPSCLHICGYVVTASASALVVLGHLRGFAETCRLVQDVGALLAQRCDVLAPVVGTEQQLPANRQGRANVCLGTATVAAVEGRQRLNGGKSSSHVSPFGSPPPKRGSGVSHLEQHLTGRGRSQPTGLYAQSGMCPKVMRITLLVTANVTSWQACARA